MIKIDYPKQIKESVEELESRLKKERHPKVYRRLEILLWLKSGKVKTMKAACDLKGMNKSQGNKIWRKYREEGLESYLSMYKGIGRYSPIKDKKELQDRLSKEGFSTINEARLWILETYGISYTENGLGNFFRANKIKLKTGRSSHPKKDEKLRSAYKKI